VLCGYRSDSPCGGHCPLGRNDIGLGLSSWEECWPTSTGDPCFAELSSLPVSILSLAGLWFILFFRQPSICRAPLQYKRSVRLAFAVLHGESQQYQLAAGSRATPYPYTFCWSIDNGRMWSLPLRIRYSKCRSELVLWGVERSISGQSSLVDWLPRKRMMAYYLHPYS
jgi:hypothetical protein